MKKLLFLTTITVLLLSGCINNQHHVDSNDSFDFGSLEPSFRGVEGVMPAIGKIYIDSVTVDTANDGDFTNMRQAALNYVLSADLIVNDYSILDGGNAKCVWETTALGTVFTGPAISGQGEVLQSGKSAETTLTKDNVSGSYVCSPVMVSFTKDGTEYGFDPDSLVTLSFRDNAGNSIKRVGYETTYTTSITLNTADRHNILTVATSPTSVLYYRADGLFQAGYTAYRGLKGIDKYIGSATYEAYVQTPGAASEVNSSNSIDYTANLEKDKTRITQWLSNSSVDTANGIESESAFVSSYGPPIALPPFREGLTEKDYRKLRLVLMRHNNFPIIISNDKKLYTMGRISTFTETELARDYRYFIRSNDNWFQYSGVDIQDNVDLNKLHVGEIKIADGTPAKFVSTLSVTSDLGTIVSLNEYDREYYIAGNPFYNQGFCSEVAKFDNTTYSFDFNTACIYNSTKKIGAVKIPGLQRLIGDGEGVLATDTHIYYTGNDGKVYQINLLPDGINYTRIKQGLPVIPELVVLEDDVDSPIPNKDDRDKLYAVDLGLPNMNPALAPTFLMNDGSIVFTVRKTDAEGNIISYRKHFYINEQVTDGTSQPGDLYNVPISHLLGPTVGYGVNNKLYYWTDVASLGVSYAPSNTNVDNDFLAFVYGDPVQMLSSVQDKSKFFDFKYGELDIQSALANVGEQGDIEGNNFVLMPYNPLTDTVEDISISAGGTITFQAVPYRPYRTNTHLFVNMRQGAKYNYILVPHYAYAFDSSSRVERTDWIDKTNGLMAAEVRHNDISKVFGAFNNPEIPFKYTPYGRNTAFFANKKGIFAFADYNVRKTENLCQDTSDTSCTNTFTTFNDKKVPDYFYRAKSTANLEEASGKNNYISTAFVSETRMANFPNNTDYTTKGFEPQLLSSWIIYEAQELPTTTKSTASSSPTLAGYIPQYFFETVKSYTGISSLTDFATFFKDIYQYAYGSGIYRYYNTNAFPVWRARKLGTEVLQYQARYGTLLPLTSGATADYLFSQMPTLFNQGPQLVTESESATYVTPRLYSHSHYAFYDKDRLKQGASIDKVLLGGIDIKTTSLGEALSSAAANDKDGTQGDTATGSGVGYIMDTGNYMWRTGSPAATAEGTVVSSTKPMNDASYFTNFVVIHK